MKKVCVYVCVSRRIHNVWHVIMIFVVVGLWSWIYLESSRTGSENALPPRGKIVSSMLQCVRVSLTPPDQPTNQPGLTHPKLPTGTNTNASCHLAKKPKKLLLLPTFCAFSALRSIALFPFGSVGIGGLLKCGLGGLVLG